SDLADMERFRTVGPDAPGDYALTVTIRAMNVNQGTSMKETRDAEHSDQYSLQDTISVTLDMNLTLEDPAGKAAFPPRLTVDASRETEISIEHTASLLNEELIDRAAQRIERLLRKKLPRSK